MFCCFILIWCTYRMSEKYWIKQMPYNWIILDLVLKIILDLLSLLLILQNTLVRIYPSPRTCEKLDFFDIFNIPHQPPLYSVSVLWQNTCNSCVADVFILTQHWRLRLASFTTSMSCDPERENEDAILKSPAAPFPERPPQLFVNFNLFQFVINQQHGWNTYPST